MINSRSAARKIGIARRGILAGGSLLGLLVFQSPALAQSADYTAPDPSPSLPPPSEPASKPTPALPPGTPEHFQKVYRSFLDSPLPRLIYDQGGVPELVPQLEGDANPFGVLGSYQPGGATITANNAFFLSLGTNGRSCVTCHQPPSGMSVSLRNIRKRFDRTKGTDPIFAPVDGANCPNLVPSANTSGAPFGGRRGVGKNLRAAYSLLLNKGLIRIALPLPANAEFTLEVLRDPTTCNTTPEYNSVTDPNTGGTTRIVSVFRRPLISSNLGFKTTTLFPGPGGRSGNIMWDGREPTLQSQAINATLRHAQAVSPPTDEQVAQMVAFETGIFSAQLQDNKAGPLNAAGAFGGPIALSVVAPAQRSFAPFAEFAAWLGITGARAAERRAIARGQQVFNSRTFTISNVSGFNNAVGSNVVTGTCASCHSQTSAGSDSFPGAQHDIGIGGQGVSFGGAAPAADLPLFRLTCTSGSPLFNPTVVTTNDPGKALITGRCADIGNRTVPSLRALAAHEPFFSDGSAATLADLVDFYDKRFAIGLTNQEKCDLVSFLNAL